MDAIGGMFKLGDQDEIKKVGFSLLDMKRYANALKFKADGFKIPKVETLKELKIPVIVLIDTANYKHFVVLRRVDDTHVYISDPSWGNRRMLHNDFAKVWNQNIIFAMEGPKVGTPRGPVRGPAPPGQPDFPAIAHGTFYHYPLCSGPCRCYINHNQYTPVHRAVYSRAVRPRGKGGNYASQHQTRRRDSSPGEAGASIPVGSSAPARCALRCQEPGVPNAPRPADGIVDGPLSCSQAGPRQG